MGYLCEVSRVSVGVTCVWVSKVWGRSPLIEKVMMGYLCEVSRVWGRSPLIEKVMMGYLCEVSRAGHR